MSTHAERQAAGDLDPIETLEWVHHGEVTANAWNPNRVARPELRLLETSLLKTGWIQPVLVSPLEQPEGSARYMIIDGFHRWRLTAESPHLARRYGGMLPVAVLDVTRTEAMLMTVRINRAKGTHGSVAMSRLVRELLEADVSRETIAEEMGATPQEIDLLSSPDVFAARKTAEWSYSPSWRPREDGTKPKRTKA